MNKAMLRVIKNITINKETNCWEWNGSVRENGYCRTTFERKNWYLHRLSFFAWNGEINNELDVCHHCDNRKCCNPYHLFQGTRKQNMEDCVLKGRQAKGKMLPQCKLTEKDIDIIVKKANEGIPYKLIANQFNVTPQNVGKILIKKGIRRHG